MATSRKYTRELRKQFGYFATWLPGTPIALGDIGVMKKNVFTKIANLEDFGISFVEEPDLDRSDIEHSSSGAVSVTTKASGNLSPAGSQVAEADAGIIVEFSKKNAILFKATGPLSPSIKDQITLGKQILELYRQGRWDKDWTVVTEVVTARSATIIISISAGGKIELKAKGDLGIAQLDIADAYLELGVNYSKDLSTTIIAKEGLTPLFKGSKIKTPFLGGPVFKMNNKVRSLALQQNGVAAMDIITPALANEQPDLLFFGEQEPDAEEEELV